MREGAHVRRIQAHGLRLLLLCACLAQFACEAETTSEPFDGSDKKAAPPLTPSSKPTLPALHAFVGSARCATCHVEEAEKWRGSDHDRAMEVATPETVLGAFDGRSLENGGARWRFVREGAAFVVERVDASGEALRLVVEFTFGVDPLQQYLVARPGGRMQALPVAWESARDSAEGGWFALQPGHAPPKGDPLHWDSLAYNWNSQCALCHSTALEKGFDGATESFETEYAEIDVGCESCHGPGGDHARDGAGPLPVKFEADDPLRWRRSEGQRIAHRGSELAQDAQMDACGGCHARREALHDGGSIGTTFLDAYRPRLLDEGLYFDDGQILDEVYVWGSFSQSRMFAAGVRCADCHDPHTLEQRREGNALCGGCHAPDAYDAPDHRGHAEGTKPVASAIQCVDCHMPKRTYMGVDARRDHGFLIPRPERSAALGSPNVCADCHGDRDAEWATRAIDDWRENLPAAAHWADHLVANGAPRRDAARWIEVALDSRASDWVKGGAWARYSREARAAPQREVLADRLLRGGPLERLGLIELTSRLAPAIQFDLLRPMLEDPRRAVRITAAEVLSGLPASAGRPADRSALGRVMREYRAVQNANAERPEAQVNLGVLAMRYGDPDAARVAYEAALRRGPYFVPAHVNLADLERALGNDADSIGHLRRAIELDPTDVWVRYALGLALHRAGDPSAALMALADAAERAPGEATLVLAHALSLDGLSRRPEAIVLLSRSADQGLADAEIYQALVSFLQEEGQVGPAAQRLSEWSTRYPNDARTRPRAAAPGGPRDSY